MRVLMVSKALVTGVYQKKAEALAAKTDLDLLVVVPPYWVENRVGRINLNSLHIDGYELAIEPMRFNGRHHVHYYPDLWRRIRSFRPDLVHIDEEPYNLVAAHTTWLAHRAAAKTLFFSWQNLYRRYPPPFNLFERYCYRSASVALAGNRDAARVLRRKGFRKPVAIIPQFGVDPEIYRPLQVRTRLAEGPVVGYIGRLVPEKGIETLIQAISKLSSRPTLRVVGSGDYRLDLELLAERLGVRDRVRFVGSLPAEKVPEALNAFDVLVLPSRTLPNWKEQFGRVLVEGMACEVPVIGSDSGEIPNVIGEAGLIFPEGDADALADCINRMISNADFARKLGEIGRRRVLALYTQERIADQTYQVYRRVLVAEYDGQQSESVKGRVDGAESGVGGG